MKSRLKQILTSFIVMILIHSIFSLDLFSELGIVCPHVGSFYVLGLLFGPYGALGAVLANIVMDFLNGWTIIEVAPSAIISFGVAYLAYKLWYVKIKDYKITKPKLDNPYHLALFLISILICGVIFSIAHANLIGIFINTKLDEFKFVSYFLNFINTAFIFGIISIWFSGRISFIETPKTSKRHVNGRMYRILLYLLIITAVVSAMFLLVVEDRSILIADVILIGVLLFAYLTKPFTHEIETDGEKNILENIVQIFLAITLFIALLGIVLSALNYAYITHLNDLNYYMYFMPALIISDVVIIMFFIPGFVILKYIENKVINPISSFSEIEKFIYENEKIEAKGLVEVYSKYVNEQNEIGTLARSYTDLIRHNNNYIENIREIEGEKERINAELDIATRIQASSLPTDAIETDDFNVDGYSKPAKEVGGDFFDYYLIDEDNLAIVIGDASGKGVPAALLAMITQVMIKQMLEHDKDPSQVLYSLNNHLTKNNPECMFLTLWLGIYDRTTKKLTFSNAGHNPPLIRENDNFRYLDIESGIVLGIMEDFDYAREEITLEDELVLYTDGITDANDINDEMYGEDRLKDFFNFESSKEPIEPLLKDINEFTKGNDQFDDMTLLYLRIKND
jgi:sigma-B regulation protein RsbU (phosphoserine phosphatase)